MCSSDLGAEQCYLEDCPVCCRPNRITAVWDEDARDYELAVEPEG